MKILVAVKAAASLDDEFELTAEGGVQPEDLDWELNEWDLFSVEAALQIAEQHEGTEVVLASVADEDGADALVACLARGAGRAIRVWDERLHAADPLAIARVLSAVVEAESPDLVLCGVQSSDFATGVTGVAVAGFLGWPAVSVVTSLDLDFDSGSAIVGRELEGGVVEQLRVPLPAVLTIQTGINAPRYATLRSIKQAEDAAPEPQGIEDFGLSWESVKASSGARQKRVVKPDPGGGAEMLTGEPAEVAQRIAEIVKERVGR